MNTTVICTLFCLVVMVVFSLNFNDRWVHHTFEKVKDQKEAWYWFDVFKINKTKYNFIKALQGLSLFVILLMVLTIFFLLKEQ